MAGGEVPRSRAACERKEQSGRKEDAAAGHKPAPGQLGIDLINGFFLFP